MQPQGYPPFPQFDGPGIYRPGGRAQRLAVTLANARVLHAGLVKGGSDLVGWSPLVITPDMVGKTVAMFTAVEVKTQGVPLTDDQKHFIEVGAAGRRAARAWPQYGRGGDDLRGGPVPAGADPKSRNAAPGGTALPRMSHEDTTAPDINTPGLTVNPWYVDLSVFPIA